jgi:hypothetical protein
LARGSDLVERIDARIAAVALVALLAALVRGWARLVAVSLVLLGAAYAVYLAVDGVALDASAPAVAAGLLLVAELAYWSLEERDRVQTEPGEVLRHVGVLAGVAVMALLVASSVVVLADVVRARGLAVDLVGAAAAAAILLLTLASARRT